MIVDSAIYVDGRRTAEALSPVETRESQKEEVKGLTQASIAQADEVKKISAWAAILFAPTLVGTVYGMNFDHMLEVRWTFGYPFALTLILVVSVSLYLAFKRRGWL